MITYTIDNVQSGPIQLTTINSVGVECSAVSILHQFFKAMAVRPVTDQGEKPDVREVISDEEQCTVRVRPSENCRADVAGREGGRQEEELLSSVSLSSSDDGLL